jgi:hypothetical protein
MNISLTSDLQMGKIPSTGPFRRISFSMRCFTQRVSVISSTQRFAGTVGGFAGIVGGFAGIVERIVGLTGIV